MRDLGFVYDGPNIIAPDEAVTSAPRPAGEITVSYEVTAVDMEGRLSNVTFTPADVYDGRVTSRLVRPETRIVVGDSHYGDKIAREKLWREHDVIVVAPVHYKQMTQIMATWQQKLLAARVKVECTFDQLPDGVGFLDSGVDITKSKRR